MLWAGEIPAPGSYIHGQGSQSKYSFFCVLALSVQSRTGYQKPGTRICTLRTYAGTL